MYDGVWFGKDYDDNWRILSGFLAIVLFIGFVYLTIQRAFKGTTKLEKSEMLLSFVIGIIFGVGLAISGMCRRTKIEGFLTMSKDWDPSLMLVMVGGLLVNFITFPIIIHLIKKPRLADKLSIPNNKTIDFKLIAGAALFGCGWGMAGLCPGPGMIDFFTLSHCVMWLPALAIGMFLGDFID